MFDYVDKWNYVRENPVRAGLVETAESWPYAGEIGRSIEHNRCSVRYLSGEEAHKCAGGAHIPCTVRCPRQKMEARMRSRQRRLEHACETDTHEFGARHPICG